MLDDTAAMWIYYHREMSTFVVVIFVQSIMSEKFKLFRIPIDFRCIKYIVIIALDLMKNKYSLSPCIYIMCVDLKALHSSFCTSCSTVAAGHGR